MICLRCGWCVCALIFIPPYSISIGSSAFLSIYLPASCSFRLFSANELHLLRAQNLIKSKHSPTQFIPAIEFFTTYSVESRRAHTHTWFNASNSFCWLTCLIRLSRNFLHSYATHLSCGLCSFVHFHMINEIVSCVRVSLSYIGCAKATEKTKKSEGTRVNLTNEETHTHTPKTAQTIQTYMYGALRTFNLHSVEIIANQ